MDAASGEPLEDKGSDSRSTLTSNGRVSIRRKRWQALEGGGVMPVDALLDAAEATVSLGARELCCRLNATGKSFIRTVAQLKHAAQLFLGETLLREVVEAEGKRVLAASESGTLKPRWQAKDCKIKTPEGKEVSRAYVGIDGFMVPLLTEQEKCKRRQQVVAARAKRGADKPKLAPLRRRKSGADERYKEFKLVQFHDEEMTHRLVSVTRKACGEAGRILRRDGRRIGFEQADERLGNVDGGAARSEEFGLSAASLRPDLCHVRRGPGAAAESRGQRARYAAAASLQRQPRQRRHHRRRLRIAHSSRFIACTTVGSGSSARTAFTTCAWIHRYSLPVAVFW